MEATAFTITGTSPLILHRFQQDAKVSIRHRNPEQESKDALYTLEDGTIYFPAENFLRMMISAAGFHKIGRRSAVGTVAGGVIVSPDVLTLKGDWVVDARPVVIAATKGRIMRYRPIFHYWEIQGILSYDLDMLGDTLVREVVDTGGRMIGLGEYRPEKKGPYGRFIVSRWEDCPD